MGWPVGRDFVWHDGVASPGSSSCLCDDSPSVQEHWASEVVGSTRPLSNALWCKRRRIQRLVLVYGPGFPSRSPTKQKAWPGSLSLAAGLSHALRGYAQVMGNMGY